jgi:hypothetical protein
MPKSPSDRQPEPMAREVDRLLAQLANFGSQPAREPTSRGETPASHPVARVKSSGVAPSSGRVAPTRGNPTRGDLVALWARVLLGIALGGLMTQWPYPNGCGLPLLGYLGGILMVLLTGGWIAFASWKLRSGVTHILALILFFWGIVLAAEQLLPRIGYAADQASWRCLQELSLHGRGVIPSGARDLLRLARAVPSQDPSLRSG